MNIRLRCRCLLTLLMVTLTPVLVAAESAARLAVHSLGSQSPLVHGVLDSGSGTLELIGTSSPTGTAILRLWRVAGLDHPVLVTAIQVSGPVFAVSVVLEPATVTDLRAGRLLVELEPSSATGASAKSLLGTDEIFADGFEDGATCAVWSSTISVEVCDDVDNDCDGLVDDNPIDPTFWHPDADGDDWGATGSTAVVQCDPPADHVANSFDCDDANPFVNPGASEACDGIDNDCDGTVDEGGDLCVSSDPCFTASCDGAGGCLFDPNPGGLCSDADACTTGDTCDAVGACIGLPVTCPAGASCQPLLGGACVCDDSSATLCAGGCFDLLSDTLHCGDCDTACGPGQSCESGQCSDPPAP